jgi:hypothetical protein
MKNIKKLALVLVTLTLLVACSTKKADKNAKIQDEAEQSNEVNNNDPKATVPADSKEVGATINKIDFDEIKIQDLKPSIKSVFESKKNYKGYFRFKDEDGYWYIGIFAGKKNTGGYSVKVLSVEDIKGETKIIVQETNPKPSAYVTQALTYPYTVIRAKDIAKPIVVKNTSGEEFKDINTLGEVR